MHLSNVILIIGLITIGSIWLFCSQESGHAANHPLAQYIEQFGEVDANLYRGAQPDAEALRQLKQQGIKKIISFRTEEDINAQERTMVETLGMEFIVIPWLIYGSLDQTVYDRFFEAIQDKEIKPVFFHCKRGAERTGVMAAAYAMRYKNRPLEEALAEAKHYAIKFFWWPFVKSKIEQCARWNTPST